MEANYFLTELLKNLVFIIRIQQTLILKIRRKKIITCLYFVYTRCRGLWIILRITNIAKFDLKIRKSYLSSIFFAWHEEEAGDYGGQYFASGIPGPAFYCQNLTSQHAGRKLHSFNFFKVISRLKIIYLYQLNSLLIVFKTLQDNQQFIIGFCNI